MSIAKTIIKATHSIDDLLTYADGECESIESVENKLSTKFTFLDNSYLIVRNNSAVFYTDFDDIGPVIKHKKIYTS